MPEYARISEQIERGIVGRPATILSSKHDTLFAPTRMTPWAAHTSPIFFVSSHDIDLVTWFLGARAARIVAHERRGILDGPGAPVHDGVDALVACDCGAVAGFHSSWIPPDPCPTAHRRTDDPEG